MKSIFLKVEQFQHKFGIKLDKDKVEALAERDNMLNEEYCEFQLAKTPEEKVDALIDLIYIAAGTLTMFGVDGDKAFDEVHNANMAKIKGTKKGRSNKTGNDVTKPADWKEPSHKDNTGEF